MMHSPLGINEYGIYPTWNYKKRKFAICLLKYLLYMEEDQLRAKQLINVVLQKSRQALPELILLGRLFQKLAEVQRAKAKKLNKKDCLQPAFLIRLSECGENIRRILADALNRQFSGREILRRQYSEYMQVIYEIRRYHEAAHRHFDLHQHSTAHKQRLLEELKLEVQRREGLEVEIQLLMQQHQRQIQEKDKLIRELQRKVGEKQNRDNFSQQSRIAKKGTTERQLQSQHLKAARIRADYDQSIQADKLRLRIQQLQSQLQEKDKLYLEQIQSQNTEILQLESKFQELMRSQSLQNGIQKCETAKSVQPEVSNDYDQLLRLLLIQSASIQQYIGEQKQAS